MTDSEFITWLSDPNNAITFLCEAQYSGGVERISNNGYFTSSSDSVLPNTPFPELLTDIPIFDTSINIPNSDDLSIKANYSWGTLTVANPQELNSEGYYVGKFDEWVNRAWEGHGIKIYMGDTAWDLGDFKVFLNGVIDTFETNDVGSFIFTVRGIEYKFDAEISKNLMTTGTNKNKAKPLVFGKVFNISPVLENDAASKYKVSDSVVSAITPRAQGLSISNTVNLSDGSFILNAALHGTLTADVDGLVSGGYLTKVSDIVKYILLNYAGFTLDDLDLNSFTAHAALCTQTVGHFKREGGEIKSVLDSLLNSVGSFLSRRIDGKLQIVRFDLPAVFPVLTITPDYIAEKSLSIRDRFIPVYQVKVNYRKNYTVQEELAATVSQSDRALYSTEYSTATATNLAILSEFPQAKSVSIDTDLQIESEAATEATRLLGIHQVLRHVYNLKVSTISYALQLGDTVRVIHPEYGFSGGLNCVVIGITPDYKKRVTELQLWR